MAGGSGSAKRGRVRGGQLFEDNQDRVVVVVTCSRHDLETGMSPTLVSKEGALWSAAGRAKHTRLLLRTCEHTENSADPLQLGRGVVAQHSGKRAVGRKEGAVPAKQAEARRGVIDEGVQQRHRGAQRVLDPAPGGHGVLEVEDLLAQAGYLVNQLLLRTMFIAHHKM